MDREGSMRFPLVVLEPGSDLTVWVDAEQNGVVSGELLADGVSCKACS